MKALFVIILNIYICTLFGCKGILKNDRPKEDNFYHDKGSWDAIRLPLSRPYELIKLKNSNEWTMSLQTPSIEVAITNVREVNVINNVIIIYSGETNLTGGVKVAEAWFAILPEKQIEKGFENKIDFERYLASLQISKPGFYNADQVYEKFSKTGILIWGPTEKSN